MSKQNSNANLGFRRFVNMCAFIACVLIALALVLQGIFKAVKLDSSVISALRLVGEIIAYLITCIAAYRYVRTKTSVAYPIIYAICVTVIVALLILR